MRLKETVFNTDCENYVSNVREKMLSPEGGNSVDGSDVGTHLRLIVGVYVAWLNVGKNAEQNENKLWTYCNKNGSLQSLNMAKIRD